MDRNEQVGLLLVGDRGASLQRNESVVLAGKDHVSAEAGLQQLAQSPADVEHQIFFLQAIGTDGAGIVSAVAGIDHDPADLQSQGADQRAVAARGRRGFADIRKNRCRLAPVPAGASRKRGQIQCRQGAASPAPWPQV